MPRPKNYAFEKAQRDRARLAKKEARKAGKAAKGTTEDGSEPSEDAAATDADSSTDTGTKDDANRG